MTAITKVSVSIATAAPDSEHSISGLYAGEALSGGDACYIKSSDGKVYKSSGLGLSAPDAPALTTATSGGTVAAGFYGVKITYVNANGEGLASESGFIITTGSTSTITVTSPAAAGSGGNAVTKFKVYMTPANGGPYKLQNTTGTNIGSNFTLTAPPVTNTAIPPTSNTTGAISSVVDGYVPTDVASGDPLTLFYGIRFRYGSSLTPGSYVYLDDTTAGALNDTATALGTKPIGRVVDATRIDLFRSY
jgi:predicted RNA-binding protein with TRAM domain